MLAEGSFLERSGSIPLIDTHELGNEGFKMKDDFLNTENIST
jgi:hypothetical protein